MLTIQQLVQTARDRLVAAAIPDEEARLDAELLARHLLGWDRATHLARRIEPATEGFARAYGALIDRRVRREPVAYITGRQEFWGRSFIVTPDVLIPRPETELLVEEALRWARERTAARSPVMVDVGTGSGCLAVTLALELPDAVVHATDVSERALEIARQNAARLGARIDFHLGRELAGLGAPIDLIVSNPPYVRRDDHAGLQPEVRVYEPETALVSGEDGLDVVRRLVPVAAGALAAGGRLLMEIGAGQDTEVGAILRASPLEILGIRADLQGIPRAVIAARGPVRRED